MSFGIGFRTNQVTKRLQIKTYRTLFIQKEKSLYLFSKFSISAINITPTWAPECLLQVLAHSLQEQSCRKVLQRLQIHQGKISIPSICITKIPKYQGMLPKPYKCILLNLHSLIRCSCHSAWKTGKKVSSLSFQHSSTVAERKKWAILQTKNTSC